MAEFPKTLNPFTKIFVSASILILGCLVQPVTSAAADIQNAQIIHLLNRTSFGPAPGDIETVRRLGIDGYLNQQLSPQTILMPTLLQDRLNALPTLSASMAALADQYQPSDENGMAPEDKKAAEKAKHIVVEELIEAKILRAVLSPAQLQEVMTDFWYNHFNVFAEKGADKLFVSSYERDAIRPYALGKFRDLLDATAHHPAMLFYLDNWMNTDPDSRMARGKKLGINENYARELMELHTLGVDGGYSQADVTALAHILTGWGLGTGKELSQRSVFLFDPRRHDFSTKNWLGFAIRGTGQNEVEEVLSVLAQNPATAHHISYELAQYFVADQPPSTLVDKLTASYEGSDGNIAEVLKTLFHSPEFWDLKNTQNKFKPPFRYVISSLRASTIVPDDTKKLQGVVSGMGEPLYHCLTPNGYANTNDQWLNSDALLKRVSFANTLGNFLDEATTQDIIDSLKGLWETNTITTFQAAEPRLRPALLLGSPEFLYY